MTSEQLLARLEKALDCGGMRTHSVADVVARIKENKAQFWQRGDGCIVTEITEYPCRKVVNYWLAWGEQQPVLDLQAEIDAWALAEGCTDATLSGRMGWKRVLRPDGWRPLQLSLYKPLAGRNGP